MSLERLGREFEVVAGGRCGSPAAEGSGRLPADACLNHLSQEYFYGDLVAATGGFSAASRLGMGTYGSVYQGTLRDGTEVAIKTLARPNESGFREEVEVLSRFRHPNLVILMGFARNSEERYLVYELLPGGDVCARLQKDPGFTWRPRLSVILDAALGLSHLHGSRPQVFHRDIKTQNILMDRNGTGKMADFGLACLAQPDCRSLTVENTSGTIGTVLLEILTGKPPALQHPDGRIEYQFTHIRGELSRVRAMLDPRGQWPPAVASLVGALALRCVHQQEGVRPTFTEIVGDLRRWLREQHSEGAPGTAVGGLLAMSPRATQPAPSLSSAYPAAGSHGGLDATGPWASAAGIGSSLHQSLPSWAAASLAAGGPPPLPARSHHSDPLGVSDRFATERRWEAGGGGSGARQLLLTERPGFRGSASSGADGMLGRRSLDGALRQPGPREPPQLGGPDLDSYSGRGTRPAPVHLAGWGTSLEGWGTSQSSSSRRPQQPSEQASAGSERPFDRGPLANAVVDCGPDLAPQDRRKGSLAGVVDCSPELAPARSRGSSVLDTSPRACVDCGPPLPAGLAPLPQAVTEGTRSSWLLGSKPLGAAEPSGADVWIDPLPRAPASGAASSSGARGGLLQSSLLRSDAPLTPSLEAPWAPKPESQASEEQLAMMSQLRAEMGFSEFQVTEAFKRCSTAEGAIDWILSPEREWNQQ